jgi:hypothetical protein
MAGIKIVDLPALGRDLLSTDLLEMSIGGTASRKITGQEIMNASKLNVGSTPIVSGTVGRVLFQGTGNVLQQSSSLFWDGTNNRLGIGTSTPTTTLDVNGTARVATSLNTPAVFSTGGPLSLYGGFTNRGRIDLFNNTTGLAIDFQGNGSSRMQLHSNGNVLINTTTDAGFRLDVNGSARVQGASSFVGDMTITGSGATSATMALTVQNSALNNILRVRNDGNVTINAITNQVGQFNLGNVQFYSTNNGLYTPVATGTALRVESAFVSGSTTSSFGFSFGTFNAHNSSALNIFGTIVQSSFAPTSGTQSFASLAVVPTINQTGGANGITRGLFIDPTLTAAADFRAIETTRGNVLFGTTSGNVGIGTSSPTYKLDVNGDTKTLGLLTAYGISTNLSDMAIYNTTNNTGYIRFITQTASAQAERMRIFNTGNVGINTTTDAGFRLDVNGSARVSGRFTVSSGQFFTVSSGVTNGLYSSGVNDLQIYNRNIAIANIFSSGSESSFGIHIAYGVTNTLPNSSALLDLTSTIKGFLPPRMTNAQRTAIVSPAVGLIVYCTDVTEGLWVFKSTGWTFIV